MSMCWLLIQTNPQTQCCSCQQRRLPHCQCQVAQPRPSDSPGR